jgi:peptidoglycan/LPS O-acetylase OafA/YrhL
MQESHKQLKPLTGVRFMLASFIFIYHYQPFAWNKVVSGIVNEMYIGVQMFFVLSGFLIAYNYYEKPLTRVFWKEYLGKRFARIYPVFFLLTTIFFLHRYLRMTRETGIVTEYFMNISLLKGFTSKYFYTGLFQSWSLTVEEVFYLIAPLIFLIYKRTKLLWSQVVVLLLIGFFLVLFFSAFPFEGFFPSVNFMLTRTFFGHCFEFILGVKLMLFFKSRFKKWRSDLFPILTYGSFIGLIAVLYSMYLVRDHYQLAHANENLPGIILANIILPLCAATLFLGLITETSIFQKFFSSRVLILLGRSSYIFYLIHAGLFAEAVIKFTTKNVVISFLLLQLISVVAFLAFEKPLNVLVCRLFKIKKERLSILHA